jgi:hypothetical protein
MVPLVVVDGQSGGAEHSCDARKVQVFGCISILR